MRRATLIPHQQKCGDRISIHALLAESDLFDDLQVPDSVSFLSTLSLRRATYVLPVPRPPHINFYPRSPCGERRWSVDVPGWILGISIHALLAESDSGIIRRDFVGRRFLSTLSLRRATQPSAGTKRRFPYFYPRSPCGERPVGLDLVGQMEHISIHALLAESDTSGKCAVSSAMSFLSTLSLRRATSVSIHFCAPPKYFYPRSPCGERPHALSVTGSESQFLSTLSLRRATC